MKNISCFIRILDHTPLPFDLANDLAIYLLRSINSRYTPVNTLWKDLIFAQSRLLTIDIHLLIKSITIRKAEVNRVFLLFVSF